MRDFILALDQGTTSCRTIVFDRGGNCKAIAKKEFPQIFPQPGWVEHDPFDIWNTQLETARNAMAQAGITAADVAAIGITNQRETTLIWDRETGKPIHNAIVWQDRRSAPFCNQLRDAGHEPLFKERTGLLLDAYFSGSKVRWLLDNVAGARELATQGRLAFGTVDTWLIWMLTGGGVHVTDATNASRTLMYDIKKGRWDEDLLDRLGVPAALLPKVCPSSAVVGETLPDLFGGPIPIAGIAGDQQAATFGQACIRDGMAKNTYGTGCFMLMNISTAPKLDPGQLITTIAWDIADTRTYALEGSVFIAGAVVQWLRDCLGIIKSSEDIEALAATVPDSGGVYFVPAFVGLGAPHWDSNARGTIVGLTRGTNAGHIARAALEAIAFQSADVLGAMQRESGIEMTQLRVDGGGSANNLMMQFQADILGVPVVRPRLTETTALGAAYLAGLAVGYWKDVAELEAMWQIDRVFEPAMDAGLRRERTAIWDRAVSRSATWLT